MPNLIARAKRLAQTNAAAMLLLRVCYWSKKQGPTRMDAAVWAEEVGLSLAEFKAAKQQLKKLGLITAEVTPGALLNTCLGLSAEGAQKFNAPFVPSVGCARVEHGTRPLSRASWSSTALRVPTMQAGAGWPCPVKAGRKSWSSPRKRWLRSFGSSSRWACW